MRRVGSQRLNQGSDRECKVVQLILDPYIPVDVVLKDERGGKILLNDSAAT